MSSGRHERLQQLFAGALLRSGEERERYLDAACGDDASLRREVLELLSFNTTNASGDLLDLEAVAADAARAGGLAIGSVLDGKFRVDGVLGEGGMGTVYRAYQLTLERPVAVKVIRPALLEMPGIVERLRREALAVARLRHSNVVAIYDFCTSPDAGAYLVMELVAGESLSEAIARQRTFSEPAAIAVLRQICDAVQAAHDVGVVHRDLKPQNILLEPPAAAVPRVKVVDFGIAKLLEASASMPTFSSVGGLVGTPLYVSPEQASGLEVDARSDVYSIGCILYEMLAGRPPFTGSSVAKILVDHTSRAPKPPSVHEPRVSPWLDAVALKTLEKEPARRYQSAAALAAALEGDDGAGGRGARSGSRPLVLTAPNNLPAASTTFVGRERELAAVLDALAAESRLVTLVGPAGVGKTRLAVRAAAEALARTRDELAVPPPDACWFVDLATAESTSDVTRAIAAALGLRAESDADAANEIVSRLGRGRPLLVLDTADRAAEPVAALVDVLLPACPDLRVLATSRLALRAHGELALPVGAMPVPAVAPATTTVASDAVALFLERAQSVSPAFDATDDMLEAVADICRALDGLPLAIELAAARVRVLSPHQILERLRDRMRLLASGTTAGRHESLRSAFDWSYEMLGASERLLFDRMSVFAGTFSIDAVEAICTDEGVDAFEALELLTSLVDKSLVVVAQGGRQARYRLLECFRAYALEKLAARGEEEALRGRHFDHFLALAETAEGKLRSRESAEWNARLRADLDDVRAALAWGRDSSTNAEGFLRLATAFHVFFYEHGYLEEGRAWIDSALERAGDAVPAKLRTRALLGVGNLAHDQGDLMASQAYQERALAITREIGDRSGIASALHNIGNVLVLLGEYDGACARFAESLEICRELGRPHNVALSLFTRGTVAIERGAWAEMEALFAECSALYASIDYGYGVSLLRTAEAYAALVRGEIGRLEALLDDALACSLEADNRHNVASVAAYRGVVARLGGRFDEAETLGAEALEAFRARGDKDCMGMTLFQLARTARARGASDVAARRLLDSLALRMRLGLRKGQAECLEEAAAVALTRGDAESAARLLGAAGRIRGEIGATIYPLDAAERAAERDAIRMQLGDAFEDARAAGAALAPEEIVAVARRAMTG